MNAVTRLYGSQDALFAHLDTVPSDGPDMYDAAVTAFNRRDLTASGSRTLWDGSTVDSALGDEAAERATIAAAQAGDRDAREAILSAYMPLVKRMQRAHKGDAGWREEVRQAAVVGLFEAVAHFDVEKAGNARLGGLAPRYIADAVSELYAGRFMLTIPKADRLAFAKARAAAVDQDGEDYGDATHESAAAIAPQFGLSTADYRVIHLAGNYVPLTKPTDDEEPGQERDAQPLTAEIRESTPIVVATLAAIREAADLTEREATAVDLSFGLNGFTAATLDEVAVHLGLKSKVQAHWALTGRTQRGKHAPGALDKLRDAGDTLGLRPAARREPTEFLAWPADVDTDADVALSDLTAAQRRQVIGWWQYALAGPSSKLIGGRSDVDTAARAARAFEAGNPFRPYVRPIPLRTQLDTAPLIAPESIPQRRYAA